MPECVVLTHAMSGTASLHAPGVMRKLAMVTTSPHILKVAFLRNTLISISLVLAAVPLKPYRAAPAA